MKGIIITSAGHNGLSRRPAAWEGSIVIMGEAASWTNLKGCLWVQDGGAAQGTFTRLREPEHS